MSIRGRAYIAGAYEYPRRDIPDMSTSQIQAICAAEALADAGLNVTDVDGYFSDSSSGAWGGMSMADYLGLRLKHIDSTETGGSSYLLHVGHAAEAIASGRCSVALVTMAGRPRHAAVTLAVGNEPPPDSVFEGLWGMTGAITGYALAAARHMHEFGTTSAQLAEVKVAASLHAQHNPHAFLREPTTIEEVLDSPMISSPLRRADCCVNTDGGGAIVVVSPEVARGLPRSCVKVLGQAETVKHADGGRLDLTYSGAAVTGPLAFAEARISPRDIKYASIYDSFTITVIVSIEDLGFCAKGAGGRFVLDGGLVAPGGKLPWNTDGGGLCNNHPGRRGGMTKIIEAVRQLRGEAAQPVQVPDCDLALVQGTGGNLGYRMGSATLILGREDT